ncbi:MAG: CRISPR-associated endonuclease Cas2 [Deltaproteobacteria bacterium]|nr:CRISPR-associated endonuclease Cas2 [Deltaproteobacteria bacterium]MBW1927826.1 CRISPR-associated endonuclease Cas2 [Deltaproteobacteria bacterium]MBW2026717.1 CRISPR-associated endonuclease Cas2 [Deltaproteobacteria bacterium]MBW2126569.1 CRISPR-associated endonuclease Cas2 [Deltaproteobacteria bacterium]RLB18035.1 MAG: CRISPR-associated endonuclease Cas2 [Deltaproteobacteria bacterium]
MARHKDNIIVTYDISDERRLQRIGKLMKDYGERILKSVFECTLSPKQFMRMKERIDKTIDHMEDSVRFYFVCDKCIKNVKISGSGQGFSKDEEVIIT